MSDALRRTMLAGFVLAAATATTPALAGNCVAPVAGDASWMDRVKGAFGFAAQNCGKPARVVYYRALPPLPAAPRHIRHAAPKKTSAAFVKPADTSPPAAKPAAAPPPAAVQAAPPAQPDIFITAAYAQDVPHSDAPLWSQMPKRSMEEMIVTRKPPGAVPTAAVTPAMAYTAAAVFALFGLAALAMRYAPPAKRAPRGIYGLRKEIEGRRKLADTVIPAGASPRPAGQRPPAPRAAILPPQSRRPDARAYIRAVPTRADNK